MKAAKSLIRKLPGINREEFSLEGLKALVMTKF